MARRGSRDVDIFNFSFLDILSCAVGALIFILVMIILSREEAPADAAPAPRPAATAPAATSAADARERQEQLARQAARLRAGLASAATAVTQLTRAIDDRQRELAERRQQRHASKAPPQVRYVPVAQGSGAGPGGTSLRPTHVECRDGHLIIHPGNVKVRDPQISGIDGPVGKLIERLERNLETETLVLWVWPDGIKTFDRFREVTKSRKINHGWEPMVPEWAEILVHFEKGN